MKINIDNLLVISNDDKEKNESIFKILDIYNILDRVK